MKGKGFADVSEVKKKTLEVLKTSALFSTRNVFSTGRSVDKSFSSQKESTVKETRVVMV